jgi:hypothetical protein
MIIVARYDLCSRINRSMHNRALRKRLKIKSGNKELPLCSGMIKINPLESGSGTRSLSAFLSVEIRNQRLNYATQHFTQLLLRMQISLVSFKTLRAAIVDV